MSDTKHITTPECGFDRNSTHSAGRYVCACGEQPAVTLSALGRELINAVVPKLEAENAALREWESRCAVALGVTGCDPEEMLNVIDNQREDAERYRWFRSKRLWDADQFPWPVGFEYPEPCLWDDGEMLDAAIDAVRKV